MQQAQYFVEFEGLPPEEGEWFSIEQILQDPEGANLIAAYKVKHAEDSAFSLRIKCN